MPQPATIFSRTASSSPRPSPLTPFGIIAPLAFALLLAFGTSAHAKPLPSQALPEVESLMQERQLDEAQTRIRFWIKTDPGNAPLHYYLAQVHAAQGNWDQAAAMLKKAKYFDWRMKFASSKQRVAEFETFIAQQQAAAKPIAPTPAPTPAPIPVLNDKITKLSPPVVPVPTPVPSTPAASVPVEPVPTEAAPPIRSASAPVPTEEVISTEMLAPVITEPVIQAINSQSYQNHEIRYVLFLLGFAVLGSALRSSHLSCKNQQKTQARKDTAALQETSRVLQQLERSLEDMVFVAPFKEQYDILESATALLLQVKRWLDIPATATPTDISDALKLIKTHRSVLYAMG